MPNPCESLEDGAGLRGFLLREMDRARLCQLPVALGLIRPDGETESRGLVLRLAREGLRSFDFAAQLPEETVAVVLSVTPLAAGERAIGALLRRVRRSSAAACVCSAGLAGYGGLAALAPEVFLKSARRALDQARSLGGGKLETAPPLDVELAPRETLVCAKEKLFLFTGGLAPEK